MSIYEHTLKFADKPVVDWDPEGELDPETHHYRISIDWDDAEEGTLWTDRFTQYLSDPAAPRTTGLVVGFWGGDGGGGDAESSRPLVEALVAARDRLPELRAIFLGDITSEENEISWIAQSDVTPLLEAYPQLERFRVRGGTGLRIGSVRHERLKELAVESGGLGREVLQGVLTSTLPELEHLELWLGDGGYGADITVEDLAPLLAGGLFPKLRYLGLRDSEIADDVAGVLAFAPIMERLETLDLSLGTLGDDGARALLGSPHLKGLRKLDLHHHYCSEGMTETLQKLEIEVDVSDQQSSERGFDRDMRFVAVSE